MKLATEPIEDVVNELNKRLEIIHARQLTLDGLTNQRKKELAAVNHRYDQLADPIREDRDAQITLAAQKAVENRERLPMKGKLLKLRNGSIQWRKNPVSLVFDVTEKIVIARIRRLGGLRRFTEKKVVVKKTALKADRAFVAELQRLGLMHFEENEVIAISLPGRKEEIVQQGNPYKVEIPPAE